MVASFSVAHATRFVISLQGISQPEMRVRIVVVFGEKAIKQLSAPIAKRTPCSARR
jgi:hypothetical protein